MENPPVEDAFAIGKGKFPFQNVSLLEGTYMAWMDLWVANDFKTFAGTQCNKTGIFLGPTCDTWLITSISWMAVELQVSWKAQHGSNTKLKNIFFYRTRIIILGFIIITSLHSYDSCLHWTTYVYIYVTYICVTKHFRYLKWRYWTYYTAIFGGWFSLT